MHHRHHLRSNSHQSTSRSTISTQSSPSVPSEHSNNHLYKQRLYEPLVAPSGYTVGSRKCIIIRKVSCLSSLFLSFLLQLCLHVFQCLSLSLSLSLSVSLLVSLCLSVCLYRFLCLPVSLSPSLSLSVCISLSICLSLSPFLPLPLSLFLCLSLFPSLTFYGVLFCTIYIISFSYTVALVSFFVLLLPRILTRVLAWMCLTVLGLTVVIFLSSFPISGTEVSWTSVKRYRLDNKFESNSSLVALWYLRKIYEDLGNCLY